MVSAYEKIGSITENNCRDLEAFHQTTTKISTNALGSFSF